MFVKPYIAFDRIANKSDINILKHARLRKSGKNRNDVSETLCSQPFACQEGS